MRAALGAALGAAFGAVAFGAMPAQAQLPPVPEPSALERELLGTRFVLKEVRVESAASLPPGVVEAIVAPYRGRTVGAGDLRELAARLTEAYVIRGFASSGVTLRSVQPESGSAVFDAVEGKIAQVRFAASPQVGNPAWLTSQLVPDPDAPARLDEIQERMAALRDTGVVDRINASLEPLPGLGRAELVVAVEEPRPWSLAIDYDNHHSPVVGARRPSVRLAHRNLTGWGDRADVRIGKTEGLEDVSASWLGFVPRTQVLAGVRFERSDSLAVDPPSFRSLDIKTLSETKGLDLGWQFATRASRTVQARLAFERRSSETTLLGLPFSFVVGLPDGHAGADVWRAGVVATERGEADVRFLRVQASRGRATSAIEDLPGAPASRFTSVFVQAQYARRLGERGLQGLLRLEGQYTRDILLPIERYSLGGATTVRGYRENVILRDRGVLGSAELRAPVWRGEGGTQVEAAVFVDTAWSENVDSRFDTMPSSITSGGLSVIVAGPWGFSARVDLAYPSHRWLTNRRDSQDRGLHFIVSWNADRVIP